MIRELAAEREAEARLAQRLADNRRRQLDARKAFARRFLVLMLVAALILIAYRLGCETGTVST